jgi:hypothetical protein
LLRWADIKRFFLGAPLGDQVIYSPSMPMFGCLACSSVVQPGTRDQNANVARMESISKVAFFAYSKVTHIVHLHGRENNVYSPQYKMLKIYAARITFSSVKTVLRKENVALAA